MLDPTTEPTSQEAQEPEGEPHQEDQEGGITTDMDIVHDEAATAGCEENGCVQGDKTVIFDVEFPQEEDWALEVTTPRWKLQRVTENSMLSLGQQQQQEEGQMSPRGRARKGRVPARAAPGE